MEATASLSGHYPHDARDSGSSLSAAPRSEFALQGQPSVRQATLEHVATPMPFPTGSFRACASGYRARYRSAAKRSAHGNSFDDLVGEDKDRIRDHQPDRLRGSEIEDHVELRGLFHG